jgi:adenylate cyclase, class 2
MTSGGSGHEEVEIKLRLDNADQGRQLLDSHGFVLDKSRRLEINVIYDTADHELRSRRCMLRLRRVDDQVLLTFKGPGGEGPHKSRHEIETHVEDFSACAAIFAKLGYAAVFRYEKYRSEYRRLEEGVVTLDETPIGVFLELEGPAEWIDRTARELGFSTEQYVTASYGRIYEEYCRREGYHTSDMTFE